MSLRPGYVEITPEIIEFIESEIDRTGIAPQRALKGNLQAKKNKSNICHHLFMVERKE